jgi:hypothetical protein
LRVAEFINIFHIAFLIGVRYEVLGVWEWGMGKKVGYMEVGKIKRRVGIAHHPFSLGITEFGEHCPPYS